MTKLEYTFKTDTLFKMLFVQYPDLLKHLVSTLLAIPLESISRFEITNSEMPPDNLGDKFCSLDINMIVNSQRVNLEIQVRNEKYYPEGVLYHWAREYSASLPEGGRYQSLPRTVIISIIDFNQFDTPDFHSEFCPLEVRRHECLSDKMSLHFFELRKLPKAPLNANDKLLLWLSLFKAETEEELTQIKDLEVPVMEQAINAYQKITVTPEFRERERLRSIARHNEASALSEAEEKGIEKGREKGREEERQRWQGVVVGKDAEIINQAAEIEKLRLQLAALQAKVKD